HGHEAGNDEFEREGEECGPGEPRPLPLAADIVQAESEHAPAVHLPADFDEMQSASSRLRILIADEIATSTDLDKPVETPPNVVPFRQIGDTKSPALTPVENNAFNELARQLSARLDLDGPNSGGMIVTSEATAASPGPHSPEPLREQAPGAEWLAQPEPPAR